jgi:hypothetical protein
MSNFKIDDKVVFINYELNNKCGTVIGFDKPKNTTECGQLSSGGYICSFKQLQVLIILLDEPYNGNKAVIVSEDQIEKIN